MLIVVGSTYKALSLQGESVAGAFAVRMAKEADRGRWVRKREYPFLANLLL